MQNDDWDDLRFFLAVARSGSVSGAAAALRVNHSTVLRRLAHLEDALSLRLFDRLPSGYALTAAGEEFAARLAGLTDQIDAAQRAVLGRDVELRGTIRVTTTDTLAQAMLEAVQAFRVRHPAIQLQFTVNNAFMSLTRREADVAVRGSNRPPENLVGRPVGVIESAVYGARTYLERAGALRGWADHAWVGFDESLAHLAQARWMASHVPKERIALTADSLVTMAEAVEAGVGLGVLLRPLAEARPPLVRVDGPFAEMDTTIWVLSHPDLKSVARIRAFSDFVVAQLRASGRLRVDPPDAARPTPR